MKALRFPSTLLVLTLLAGCGGPAAAPSVSPAASAAASVAKPAASGSVASKPSSLMKITLGTPSAAAPSALVPLAKDAGLYEQYGFDSTIQVFDGSKTLLASMFSGEVPITYQGSPEVIAAALSGADVVMFAGIINTLFFSVYTRPDITDPAQLSG